MTGLTAGFCSQTHQVFAKQRIFTRNKSGDDYPSISGKRSAQTYPALGEPILTSPSHAFIYSSVGGKKTRSRHLMQTKPFQQLSRQPITLCPTPVILRCPFFPQGSRGLEENTHFISCPAHGRAPGAQQAAAATPVLWTSCASYTSKATLSPFRGVSLHSLHTTAPFLRSFCSKGGENKVIRVPMYSNALGCRTTYKNI